MPRVKILPNGNHYGIDKAFLCCVPARKINGVNAYAVKRKHLVALGANPYSDNEEIKFISGIECVKVSMWKSFKEWASGNYKQC